MQFASTLEYIEQIGGKALSAKFIQHRTIPDILGRIQCANDSELFAVDGEGNTLLHHAAFMKDGEVIVKALLARGLDFAAANDDGLKPVNFARTSEVAIVLIKESMKAA